MPKNLSLYLRNNIRFFAEFILSKTTRFFATLRMTGSEGFRMTGSEGLRMTVYSYAELSDNLTAAESLQSPPHKPSR
jgi:hypothetical protein